VSSYDTYPPEVKSRAKVGALIDPDVERILSLKPDLVVVYASQTELMTAARPRAHTDVPLRARGTRRHHLDDSLARSATGTRRTGRSGRGANRARPRGDPSKRGRENDVRGLRCSSSASRGHCATSTRVAALDSCTTCSTRRAAKTCSPTSSVRAFRQRPNCCSRAPRHHCRSPHVRPMVRGSHRPRARRLEGAAVASSRALGRIYLLQDERLAIPGPRVAEAVKLLADRTPPESAAAVTRYRNRSLAAACRYQDLVVELPDTVDVREQPNVNRLSSGR
jgi:hypothetical protein